MNVFDLPGPEFLKLYVTLFAGAIGLLILLRYVLRGPFDEPLPGSQNLSSLAAAYLARGRRGTVDAAITSLAHRGAIKLKMDGVRPRVTATAQPIEPNAVETSVWAAVAKEKGGLLLGPARRAGADAAERAAEPLERLGLVLADGGRTLVRMIPPVPLMICLAIGGQKILFGVSRDKPVGFLVAACIITLFTLIYAVANSPHRTRRGDKLLALLRKRHASMEVTSLKHMGPDEATLAFGLFGAAVLMGADQDLYRAMRHDRGTGSSCGSSSCGSSGCGGGGSDGGGGGCGGCGGGGD